MVRIFTMQAGIAVTFFSTVAEMVTKIKSFSQSELEAGKGRV
jgi:hypothetical protein